MAENKIHFKIITPEKIVYEDDVESIIAKGVRQMKRRIVTY